MGKAAGRGTSWISLLATMIGAVGGSTMAFAASNALLVPVPGTNAPNVLNDIRGIKEPVPLPGSYTWLWWLLGLLVVAAVAWWAWRKWGRKPAAAEPGIVIPPHRRAKDRLRSASGLISDPYQFCSLVSDVVRVYLEERFNLHAPERTTEEFMEEARGSTVLLPAHKTMLEQFLTRCDMVKFAREEPTEPELKALLDAAFRLIDETAPAETPASPGQVTEGRA